MAEERGFVDLLRRATMLNLRLYQRSVDLSVEYLRDVGQLLHARTSETQMPAAMPTAPASGDRGVIVLEAESGKTASAAFLVTNELDRTVMVRLRAGAFTDPQGAEVEQTLEFVPPHVELAARGRQTVAVSARIGAELERGVPYRGEIAVDGMKNLSVPVVLRRRNTVDEAAAGTTSDPEARPARARSVRRQARSRE